MLRMRDQQILQIFKTTWMISLVLSRKSRERILNWWPRGRSVRCNLQTWGSRRRRRSNAVAGWWKIKWWRRKFKWRRRWCWRTKYRLEGGIIHSHTPVLINYSNLLQKDVSLPKPYSITLKNRPLFSNLKMSQTLSRKSIWLRTSFLVLVTSNS